MSFITKVDLHPAKGIAKANFFITVRNENAKVMFLQVCVCPRDGGGVSQHALQQVSGGEGVLSQHALQVLSQHGLQQVSGGGGCLVLGVLLSGGLFGGVSVPRGGGWYPSMH